MVEVLPIHAFLVLAAFIIGSGLAWIFVGGEGPRSTFITSCAILALLLVFTQPFHWQP